MNDKKLVEKIDITPSTNIYGIFSKLTYKHHSAISEFIDNSTQSYKDNKENNSFKKIFPKIYIFYYDTKNEEKIQILDNCYGIKNENLERVLKLNIPPSFSNTSRNEFGMGLKTSSFWFGKRLRILSKNIAESETVDLEMSLDNLENKEIIPRYKEGNYFYEKIKLKDFEFGTIVEVSQLTKKLTDKKLFEIKDVLASKYREDIENDNLEIRIVKISTKNEKKNSNDSKKFYFYDVSQSGKDNSTCMFSEIEKIYNAVPIAFTEPKIKQDTDGKELKIEINDYLEFENNKYLIKGWVGILEKGSRQHAGLILFRNNRTIRGDGLNEGYRPHKIFKDAASYEWQRIYGKIYLDDFPVVQAKNDFDWHNGLEDEFIDFMFNKISTGEFDLIKKARTERYNNSFLEKSKIVNRKVAEEVKEEISKDQNFKNFDLETREDKKGFNGIIEEENGEKHEFELFILKGDESIKKEWLEIKGLGNDNKYILNLNLDLEFFSPFNADIENVKKQMIIFCIYFAYAEIKHRSICTDFSNIRKTLNKCITKELKMKENNGEENEW